MHELTIIGTHMYDEDTAKDGDDEKTRCISPERSNLGIRNRGCAVIAPKKIEICLGN